MCLLCYIELTSIPVNLRHVSPSSFFSNETGILGVLNYNFAAVGAYLGVVVCSSTRGLKW